jgi:hypothetical protein
LPLAVGTSSSIVLKKLPKARRGFAVASRDPALVGLLAGACSLPARPTPRCRGARPGSGAASELRLGLGVPVTVTGTPSPRQGLAHWLGGLRFPKEARGAGAYGEGLYTNNTVVFATRSCVASGATKPRHAR